jgi:hypothetical protein
MNISTYGNNETLQDFYNLGFKATVVPDRSFDFAVPYSILPTDKDVDVFDLEDTVGNIVGPVIDGCVPVVTHQDQHSLLAAFDKRLNFKSKHKFTKDTKRDLDYIMSCIKPVCEDTWYENECDRERWLNKHCSAKRARMEKSWLEAHEYTTHSISSKDGMVKIEALLKRELLDPELNPEDGKPLEREWAPRVICIGTDDHNALFGPFWMVAMERLCALFDTEGYGQELLGMNIKYAYKTGDVAILEHLNADPECEYVAEGDFSSNDATQCDELLQYVCKLFKEKCKMDPAMIDLYYKCRMNTKFRAYEYGLVAMIEQQLATGDTSTTPNNCAVNTLVQAVDTLRQKVTRSRIIILGDDSLRKDNKRMDKELCQANAADLGMKYKIQFPEFNCHSGFLSRRVFNDTTTPFLVPKPGKFLCKFNVRATQNEAVSDACYMYGKALAHAYECRHVPQIAHKFMRCADMWYQFMDDEEKTNSSTRVEHDKWFLKISGLRGDAEIKNAVYGETVTCTDDELEDWTAELYQEIGWYDLSRIIDEVLFSVEPKVITPAGFEHLMIDI